MSVIEDNDDFEESFSEAKVSEQIEMPLHNSNTNYPIVPLRNMVINQQLIVSVFVGRKHSMKVIEENEDKPILFLLQKQINNENPKPDDFYKVGTVAKILHLAKMPDNTLKITIEGQMRVRVNKISQKDGKLYADVNVMEQLNDEIASTGAQLKSLENSFVEYSKLKKQYSAELMEILREIQDPFIFIDFISTHTEIPCEKKQDILEESHLSKRIKILLEALEYEMENIKISNQISQDIKKQFETQQKKILLAAKLEATRKALESIDGEDSSPEAEIDGFSKKLKEMKLSAEAKEKAEKEIRKLKNMNSMSTESTVIRNYLDWLFALPWGQHRKVKYDLKKAKKILEQNHYGLPKIKERIYEMIAVEKRIGVSKSPIICFYGPPGVGKTSLASSIAQATGREFIRISLGGLHDEAEIRGHRSTYIGAKPGKIIQGLKRAKTENPVFLLDEIGEIGQDPRGNPAAALLEILDPEHRNEFRDNFLEVAWPFDKSMVIASANRLDTLPPALIDRMEIITLTGYTEEEKMHICKHHLIQKQMKTNGIKASEVEITTEAVLHIIQNYTKEAGVRNLERQISKICRKIVKTNLENSTKDQVIVNAKNVEKYLGVASHSKSDIDLQDKLGVASGLAWTQVGGEILYVEALSMPGNGKITITGKLGEVMKESVQAAWSVVKSKAKRYNIEPSILEKTNLHLHVPEGATPKDGPSAGVAICTAIASAISKKLVKGNVAMTGEISLSEKVLKIGGLKEKLLAAISNNIDTVFIPKDNAKDLTELKDEIPLEKLKIIPVNKIDEILDYVLIDEKQNNHYTNSSAP